MEPDYINKIICGDAISEMKNIKENSISLIVTSPPYWNLVDYEVEGQYGQGTYEEYLDEMLKIFNLLIDKIKMPSKEKKSDIRQKEPAMLF